MTDYLQDELSVSEVNSYSLFVLLSLGAPICGILLSGFTFSRLENGYKN
jgi:hypothetical protein